MTVTEFLSYLADEEPTRELAEDLAGVFVLRGAWSESQAPAGR